MTLADHFRDHDWESCPGCHQLVPGAEPSHPLLGLPYSTVFPGSGWRVDRHGYGDLVIVAVRTPECPNVEAHVWVLAARDVASAHPFDWEYLREEVA